MSVPTPRRSCPQHPQALQPSCPSCAAALCLSAGGRAPAQKPNTEAERLRQYHQDPEVKAQRLRDQQVLLAQRCAPSESWGPDRSVANRIISGGLPSQLPSCYPYPRAIELDANQLTAPETQTGPPMPRPAPAPAGPAHYQSQYMSQHRRDDDRGRTPSSNGNYTYRPALQSITGRSSYNSRNSGSTYHGGNNDENEDEDSDEDDDNQS